MANYALSTGILVNAYQAFFWWRRGYWSNLAIGAVWESLGVPKPFFTSREAQFVLHWAMGASLSTACFAVFGIWVLWRTAFSHFFRL